MWRRTRHALAALLAVVAVSAAAYPQPVAHVAVGVGATDLTTGMNWRPGARRLGIDGELGIGTVFLASLGGSVHAFLEPVRKWDPFVAVSLMGLGSSEFSSLGVAGGAGVVYWPSRRAALRLDGFRFVPITTQRDVPREQQSTAPKWGLRGGVAFRLW